MLHGRIDNDHMMKHYIIVMFLSIKKYQFGHAFPFEHPDSPHIAFFQEWANTGPRNGERPEQQLRPFSLTRQIEWTGQLSERTIP